MKKLIKMKDIIILGTGKAANMHFKSYKKMRKVGRIFFVNKEQCSKFIEEKIYYSIEDVILKFNLNPDNIIADLCTPKSEFENIINECIRLKIINIIVEKPFLNKGNINLELLNIIMVQNYEFSCITNGLKKMIEDKNYEVKMINTFFAKNRIADSMEKRGMVSADMVTSNFEIEMPHQIYIVNYLLNKINFNNDENKILYVKTLDMVDKDVRLKNHGYGKILTFYKNVMIIHESDLTSNIMQKKVLIFCNDNVVIEANYFLYDKNWNKLENGYIMVYHNNILKEKWDYHKDDNLYEALNHYYKILNNNEYEEKYRKKIQLFSEEINQYLNILKDG